MSPRTNAAIGWALALVLSLAVAPGCAGRTPAPLETDVGRHRVRVVLPRGWEHLDHGRQHLFRFGEWQLSLTDRGAANGDSSLVFAELAPAALREHVFGLVADPRRQELASSARRVIHGTPWIQLETWDRVSHMARSRAAYTLHDGALLVLAIDHGPCEPLAPGFDSLLASLELPGDSAAVR